ncbi:CPBP family glutamic-type intramembrane protease [uncultured Psychroserpens sp.]|uniref:CPBP family glutamic-type intramembrane protease n=1 Tax=uncultured Psychroserpens sp. TaxID=255436 RepID=UPI00262AC2D7|nr:CPBP family glutamic-type intramembrane protease [uncultured Psychroserpens sp.]
MKTQFFIVFALFSSLISFSQDIKVNQNNSHELFVETLNNSKDIRYNDILNKYNTYIDLHPNNIDVRIYRCKFIGSAYYDEYEDYNLNYEETEACINQLYSEFPAHPEVILYNLDNAYYDDREDLINEAIAKYESDKTNWTYQQIGRLYELASFFYVEDNDFKAIMYAEKAERFSDSLDLSVLLAKANIRMGNTDKAKDHLIDGLFYDGEAWTLQQKGELLIEFGETDKALEMFDRVKEKDSTYSNNKSLYKIFIESENYEAARSFLVQDTIPDWNKTENIQKLLNHDISYSSADTALVSYRRMQELSYYDDFFGIKRLRISGKPSFDLWTLSELSHILLLGLCIIILFLIPYILILPIYSAKTFFKLKPIAFEKCLPVNWTLKHFWLIVFVYLITQTSLVFIFYYQNYMNVYFDIVYNYVEEGVLESQLLTANSLLYYTVVCFVLTLLFLNKKRLKFIFNSDINYGSIIALSVLFMISNFTIIKFLRTIMPFDETTTFYQLLNMKEEIGLLLNEYGFSISVLAVAVLVPFYEEVMFRGIILSSTEKYLGFRWANVIQATLFGVVHFNLQLFLFYFFFGLVTGYAVKRTNGLLTGIVFHTVNNFIVLLAIYVSSKLLF